MNLHLRLCRRFVALVSGSLLCLSAGCAERGPTPSTNTSRTPVSPADPLIAADIERFLAVLDSQSGMMIPAFTAPTDNDHLDAEATAQTMIDEFRERVRCVFDPERQGTLWDRDPAWSQALIEQDISPAEFAALVRSVSCAIMRVRLEKRVDLEQLVRNVRAEVDRVQQCIEEIDEIPRSARSRDDEFERTQAVIRLERVVALREFAEMVNQVPPGNCSVIREFSRRLKPLLPPRSNDDLLAELEKLGNDRSNRVEPAGYEQPTLR